MRAVRATIVMAGLFAFTYKVIGNLQMATFAAFGSFATLVLSSFAGTRRERLMAHLLLAVSGSVLLSIGTAVSSSTLLAALVTIPVTFAVFFAGVAGPNAASGATGALLPYLLSAASPGTVSMIPDRLAGWWLASVAGTAAVMILTPRPGADQLRAAASRTARTLARGIEQALGGGGDDELASCVISKHELLSAFNAAPYRPLGLAVPDQALANVVELLEWCTSLLLDAVREDNDLQAGAAVDRELMAATADALNATAALLAGQGTGPEIERLAGLRQVSLEAVGELASDSATFARDARISFHAQALAVAGLAVGAEAMVATRVREPEWLAQLAGESAARAVARTSRRISGVAAAASRHATVRSVWFINSARVALALGAAVAVADISSVQHGFWVVLGALSVLRTNAASTRATALQALSGTILGFAVGGVLLLIIGSSTTALWVSLPIAVFIAAYSPGTAPLPFGQAAFTVTVAVLFNLLAPIGWKVGLLRVEDVAIGCLVSLLFGLMFWPRGIAAVVGDDLADAFRSGATFLAEAIGWTAGLKDQEPAGEPAAVAAGIRLDDALRGFLTERGSKRLDKEQLWRLVGGTLRLRLTAHAVAGLPRDPLSVTAARDALTNRTAKLTAWYESLAELLDRPHGTDVAVLAPPSFGPEDVVEASSGSHYGVWLCEHLDHLAEHLHEMTGPATRLAELRRAPWWR
jgi:hypothetical protein